MRRPLLFAPPLPIYLPLIPLLTPLIPLLPILALLLAPAACPSARPRGTTTSARVVSLHDVTTEIVVALDAADRLVGVADPVEVPAPVRQAISRIPRVEGAETIAALSPTVVLGTDVVAEKSPELVAFLRNRKIDVWLATQARLNDVFIAVREVAARIGVVEDGRALIARLRARLIAVGPPPPGAPVPVFVYDCCDPPFTAAKKAVISDVIERAGGRNVFADLDADWTKVSWEEAIARKPRLVIVHAYDHEGQGDVASKRRQLRALPTLANLPTTTLPLGLSLGGIRSIDALERLFPFIHAAASAPAAATAPGKAQAR